MCNGQFSPLHDNSSSMLPARARGPNPLHDIIWKPHHLDKTRQFGTLEYIPVYTGTSHYILTCTNIYRYIPIRPDIYLYIRYQRNDGFFIIVALLSGRNMHVYTSHVQYNTSWCFKCKSIHVLCSYIQTRYIHVHTGIYFHR